MKVSNNFRISKSKNLKQQIFKSKKTQIKSKLLLKKLKLLR